MKQNKLIIFDLDNTILTGDSDYSFINFLISKNLLNRKLRKKNDMFLKAFEKGTLHFQDWGKFSLEFFYNKKEGHVQDLISEFISETIEPMINISMLRVIHNHNDQGDILLLASATNEILVRPIGARLGFKNIIASRVRVNDGKYTNEFINPPAIGEGKLMHVQSWCADKGFLLEDATFYSDSIYDLPLLRSVKEPIAVNPDQHLLEIADKKGWEVIET